MKILVVDDDRRMVKTTCDVLRIKGYEATGVFSGEEAIETVKADLPDCVLMDLKMPGMNGVKTLRKMKEIAPQLDVVLMSAYATDELEAEAKALGAYAVLPKPFNLQNMLSFLALLRKEESILIVDDDANFCKTLKDILTMRGYRVKTESRPEHVMEDMENEYQLVVLLDLKLGAASGIDVLKEIRAKYPTKPVVLATGYGQEMASSIEKGLQIGAYSCLYKPLEVDALLNLIAEISRKKRQAALESV
jgi:two-component system response regulator HydG